MPDLPSASLCFSGGRLIAKAGDALRVALDTCALPQTADIMVIGPGRLELESPEKRRLLQPVRYFRARARAIASSALDLGISNVMSPSQPGPTGAPQKGLHEIKHDGHRCKQIQGQTGARFI
jgi:hypothetical protein